MLYEGMSRNGLQVELQVFYGFLFINNHAQGCDADFNMLLYIILGHQIVAFIGFYTFRNHGLDECYQAQGMSVSG